MSANLYIKIYEVPKVIRASKILRDIFKKRYGSDIGMDAFDENEVPYLTGLRDAFTEYQQEDATTINTMIDAIHEGFAVIGEINN